MQGPTRFSIPRCAAPSSTGYSQAYPMLAQRAPQRRGRIDPVNSCAKRMGIPRRSGAKRLNSCAKRMGIPRRSGARRLYKHIQLGSTDEIVFRQTADGVRRESNVTVVVAQCQVRVVVLGIRDVGQRVDEAHGAVKILEL